MAEEFQVILNGNGISVERSVSQSIARQILDLLLGETGASAVAQSSHQAALEREAATQSEVGRERPTLSLREFLEETMAGRNPDKILAIGDYMLECEGAEDFGRVEVKSRFRTAGEAMPKNFTRDFGWALKNGWIAEDPNKPDRFYVTRTGKTALSEKFSDDIKKASAQKSTGRRRLRKPKDKAGAE